MQIRARTARTSALAVALFGIALTAWAGPPDGGIEARPAALPAPAPEAPLPPTPLQVATGIYVNDVARIDIMQHEFFADFYLWFRAKLRPGETWTPQSIELMNALRAELTKVEEKKLPDGSSYWEYRAKGTFRGHFDLADYPLDLQTLPIAIEDATAFARKLVFVPDPTHTPDRLRWLDKLIHIPDFEVRDVGVNVSVHEYGTNFGDTTPGLSADLSRFSRFKVTITIERIFLPHLVKFLIPLLVISGMAYVTFFMKAPEFSTTSRLCGTALLSSIALHITSSRNLPEVGYLLVSDKVFILFYLVIFLTLLEKVAANRLVAGGKEAAAHRLERAFRVGFPAFLLTGSLLVYYTR
jgi:hypothetical protein